MPTTCPKVLTFNGKEVRVYQASAYSFSIVEENGEIINDIIYRRNLNVQERLNLVIRPIPHPNSAPWEDFVKTIDQSVLANSDDYELICGSNWYTTPLVFSGSLTDLSNAPYLDITKDYWAGRYIEGMSYKGHYYFVTGSSELTIVSCIASFFANTNLWNDLYGTSVHDIVRNGTRTLDTLNSYINEVYQELNGNSSVDFEDQLGFVIGSDYMVERLAYSSGIEVAPFDEDGVPYLAFIQDTTPIVTFWEKWIKIKNSTYCPTIRWDGVNVTNTITEGQKIFKNGKLLFCTGMLSDTTSHLRDMDDDYAILPLPKLDENQENYISVINDNIPIYGVPKTVTTEAFNASMALLEASAAEGGRTIIPTYLETALKNKYIRDIESVDTINMLIQNPMCDFGAQYLDLGFYSFLRYEVPDANIASSIAKSAQKFMGNLDKLLTALEGLY